MEDTLNVRLISAVQRRPALYDKRDVNYFNRNFLHQQWKEVALEVDCDERRIRKKWTKLRDYFQKNHRLMTISKTGPPPEQRKKKWFLYDSLTFLLPHLRDKETHTNLSDDSDGSHDIEDGSRSLDSLVINSVASTSGCTPIVDTEDQEPLLKRPKYSQERAASTCAAFDPQIVTVKSTAEDEDELYFKSLIPKMRLLDPIAKMECQMEIHSVVLKYLKRTLGQSDGTRPVQTQRPSDHTAEIRRSLGHTQSLPDNQPYDAGRIEYDNNLSTSYLHYFSPTKTENIEED